MTVSIALPVCLIKRLMRFEKRKNVVFCKPGIFLTERAGLDKNKRKRQSEKSNGKQ